MPTAGSKSICNADSTWGATHAGVLRPRPVAYFSAEFGLHESFPIYSGGLGILAGDHIKSASDLDIPLVGVGFFTARVISASGSMRAAGSRKSISTTDVNQLPMEPAIGKTASRSRCRWKRAAARSRAKVWRVKVGRCDLLLLDSNVEGNAPEDRELTSRLMAAMAACAFARNCCSAWADFAR